MSLPSLRAARYAVPRGSPAFTTEDENVVQSELDILKRKYKTQLARSNREPVAGVEDEIVLRRRHQREKSMGTQRTRVEEREKRRLEAENEEAFRKAKQTMKDIEVSRHHFFVERELREKERDLDERKLRLDALLASTPNKNSLQRWEQQQQQQQPQTQQQPAAERHIATSPPSLPTSPLPPLASGPPPPPLDAERLARLPHHVLRSEMESYASMHRRVHREVEHLQGRLATMDRIMGTLQAELNARKSALMSGNDDTQAGEGPLTGLRFVVAVAATYDEPEDDYAELRRLVDIVVPVV